MSPTPRVAVTPSVPKDIEIIAVRVGVRHGVHPSANTAGSPGYCLPTAWSHSSVFLKWLNESHEYQAHEDGYYTTYAH